MFKLWVNFPLSSIVKVLLLFNIIRAHWRWKPTGNLNYFFLCFPTITCGLFSTVFRSNISTIFWKLSKYCGYRWKQNMYLPQFWQYSETYQKYCGYRWKLYWNIVFATILTIFWESPKILWILLQHTFLFLPTDYFHVKVYTVLQQIGCQKLWFSKYF